MLYEDREWHRDLLIPTKNISKTTITRKTQYGEKEYRIISLPKESKYPEYQTYWNDRCIYDEGNGICVLSYYSGFSVKLSHKDAKKGTRYKRYSISVDEFRDQFSQEISKLKDKEAARISKENELRSKIDCSLVLIRLHANLQLVFVDNESKQIVFLYDQKSIGRKKIRNTERWKIENHFVVKDFGSSSIQNWENILPTLEKYNKIYEEIARRKDDFQTTSERHYDCYNLYKQLLITLHEFYNATTQQLESLISAALHTQ